MFFPPNFRFYELFLTAHGSLVATHPVINSSWYFKLRVSLSDDTLIKYRFIMRTEGLTSCFELLQKLRARLESRLTGFSPNILLRISPMQYL